MYSSQWWGDILKLMDNSSHKGSICLKIFPYSHYILIWLRLARDLKMVIILLSFDYQLEFWSKSVCDWLFEKNLFPWSYICIKSLISEVLAIGCNQKKFNWSRGKKNWLGKTKVNRATQNSTLDFLKSNLGLRRKIWPMVKICQSVITRIKKIKRFIKLA